MIKPELYEVLAFLFSSRARIPIAVDDNPTTTGVGRLSVGGIFVCDRPVQKTQIFLFDDRSIEFDRVGGFAALPAITILTALIPP